MAWNHLKLCKNDRVCLLSWKKSFLASQTHFWSFQNFTYGLVSESMIWYLGKSGVKYGKLATWLEITWNFAKMIAYAFFHEKSHFEPVKLIFWSFQNFTLVSNKKKDLAMLLYSYTLIILYTVYPKVFFQATAYSISKLPFKETLEKSPITKWFYFFRNTRRKTLGAQERS